MAKLPAIMNPSTEGQAEVPTAQELKRMFLEKAAPLLNEYIDAALGKGELKSTNANCREEVWDLLKSLILKSSEKLQLQAATPEEILGAVTEGKCTIEEAKSLLAMFKQVKEIETQGIVEGSQTLHIHIEGAPQDPELIYAGQGVCRPVPKQISED